MRQVLCIFLGLPRTILQCFDNINNQLIQNNPDFKFKYIVNTEGTPEEINLIKRVLNINDSDIILFNVDKNKIKSAFEAYIHRLYQCLKKEQHNVYDIYINLRFDLVFNKPIDLNHYMDKYCVITLDVTRKCSFHNRDWDLMAIGNHFNYKMFNYPFLNIVLKKWLNENVEPLEDTCMDTNIKDHTISNDEIISINKKCGLITDEPCHLFSVVIKNLLNNGGNYIVSESFEQIHVNIIRPSEFVKGF